MAFSSVLLKCPKLLLCASFLVCQDSGVIAAVSLDNEEPLQSEALLQTVAVQNVNEDTDYDEEPEADGTNTKGPLGKPTGKSEKGPLGKPKGKSNKGPLGKPKGKGGSSMPIDPLPTTPAPTPSGHCRAYTGNEEVPTGQIPYVGMEACQTSNYCDACVVDALTNSPDPQWKGTCTHTLAYTGVNNAWWVKLPATSIIRSVQITNRGGSGSFVRLHNADIIVGGQFCANTGSIGMGETVKYDCPSPLIGNEIILQSHGQNHFTICGFAAYGEVIG